MPTYEYRCPKGHEFEKFQRMSDPPVAVCPECGAEAERLISAGAGLLFKGEGFYITDYRSEGYKKAAEKEKSASSDAGGSKSEGGSKSASGAKPEAKPAASGKKASGKSGGPAASSSD
ncbi:MAG TPA: zinc ribbon domain-containing protein [Longimicrobiales bacterium]